MYKNPRFNYKNSTFALKKTFITRTTLFATLAAKTFNSLLPKAPYLSDKVLLGACPNRTTSLGDTESWFSLIISVAPEGVH